MKLKLWHMMIAIFVVAIYLTTRAIWISSEDDAVPFSASVTFAAISGVACGWVGFSLHQSAKRSAWIGGGVAVLFAIERVLQFPGTEVFRNRRHASIDLSSLEVNLAIVLFSSVCSLLVGAAVAFAIGRLKSRIIHLRIEIAVTVVGGLIGALWGQLAFYFAVKRYVQNTPFVVAAALVGGILASTWAVNRKR